MTTKPNQTIVVAGNPVDGLVFHGPFPNVTEATDWAEGAVHGDWWLAPLCPALSTETEPGEAGEVDEIAYIQTGDGKVFSS